MICGDITNLSKICKNMAASAAILCLAVFVLEFVNKAGVCDTNLLDHKPMVKSK